MIDKTKRFICHPITVFVCLILAIGSVVAFAIVKNINQSKADLVSKVKIAAITRDKDDKLVAVAVDDKQEQQINYEIVNMQFQNAINPEKSITDMIDSYINTRYNFSNGASSFDDARKKEIEDITTSEFYQNIITSISKEKTQNSQANIIKRFLNGRGEVTSDSQIEVLGYLYIVEINGEQQAIKLEVKGEKGDWKISSEAIVGSVKGGQLW